MSEVRVAQSSLSARAQCQKIASAACSPAWTTFSPSRWSGNTCTTVCYAMFSSRATDPSGKDERSPWLTSRMGLDSIREDIRCPSCLQLLAPAAPRRFKRVAVCVDVASDGMQMQVLRCAVQPCENLPFSAGIGFQQRLAPANLTRIHRGRWLDHHRSLDGS